MGIGAPAADADFNGGVEFWRGPERAVADEAGRVHQELAAAAAVRAEAGQALLVQGIDCHAHLRAAVPLSVNGLIRQPNVTSQIASIRCGAASSSGGDLVVAHGWPEEVSQHRFRTELGWSATIVISLRFPLRVPASDLHAHPVPEFSPCDLGILLFQNWQPEKAPWWDKIQLISDIRKQDDGVLKCFHEYHLNVTTKSR
ncbi:hypothetical protein EJB05_19588, partial [Eragrostis curvula]